MCQQPETATREGPLGFIRFHEGRVVILARFNAERILLTPQQDHQRVADLLGAEVCGLGDARVEYTQGGYGGDKKAASIPIIHRCTGQETSHRQNVSSELEHQKPILRSPKRSR